MAHAIRGRMMEFVFALYSPAIPCTVIQYD
jgi:hypothetical protein